MELACGLQTRGRAKAAPLGTGLAPRLPPAPADEGAPIPPGTPLTDRATAMPMPQRASQPAATCGYAAPSSGPRQDVRRDVAACTARRRPPTATREDTCCKWRGRRRRLLQKKGVPEYPQPQTPLAFLCLFLPRAGQHTATLIEDDDSPGGSRTLSGQQPRRTGATARIENPVTILNRRADERASPTAICPGRDQRVLRVIPAGKPIIESSKSVGIHCGTHRALACLK